MATISYAITANNEAEELDSLLVVLQNYIVKEDEIVVQLDSTATEEVLVVLQKHNIIPINFSLDGDFAAFKNNIKSYCIKDYIFFIDADEYPNHLLLTIIKEILEWNAEVELFNVPRENYVKGITTDHISRWGWHRDEFERINYPDYQTRLIKNLPTIKWENKVHERLVGAKKISNLPMNADCNLIHIKQIAKQEKQNELYSSYCIKSK